MTTPDGTSAKSHQRLREEALRLSVSGLAVIATDPGGRVVYWDRAAEELYGWTAAEAVGRDVVEMIPAAPSREQADSIMARIREGKGWSGRFMVRGKDGIPFWASVRNTPLRDENGEIIGVIGMSEPADPAPDR